MAPVVLGTEVSSTAAGSTAATNREELAFAGCAQSLAIRSSAAAEMQVAQDSVVMQSAPPQSPAVRTVAVGDERSGAKREASRPEPATIPRRRTVEPMVTCGTGGR